MKALVKSFFILLSVFFIYSNFVFSQEFKKSPFIDIPGDNYDFDLLDSDYPGGESYIAWINKIDLKYSIYLKRISPEIGDNINVYSDSIVKSNPKLGINIIIRG